MLRKTSSLLALVLLCGIAQTDGVLRADEPVKTGQQRDTLLYVRTNPPGAKVFFNGKELGTTNRLFQVEPGKGTLTIEWEGRKAGETEVTIRANAVTRVELSLETKAEATGDRFIAHWPQGTVELVGVTDYPVTGQSRWWKPDGSAAELGTFRPESLHLTLAPDQKPCAFLFRFKDLPNDASWPAWSVRPCAGKRENVGVLDAQGEVVPKYSLCCAELGTWAKTARIQVGLDMGDWETVFSQSINELGTSSFFRDGLESTVTLLKAEIAGSNADESTRVTLTSDEPYPEWRSRIVAVTREGKEQAAWISSSKGCGTAFFQQLPVASIKEFRYQVRPFSWVEFKNIALQSGQKTDVKAVSSREPATSEK